MAIRSFNPATEELLIEFSPLSDNKIKQAIDDSQTAYLKWKDFTYTKRAEHLIQAAKLLRDNKNNYAEIITAEMGKPIKEAVAEVEKSAWNLEYYAEQTEEFLRQETIETDASKSYVRFDPLGTILFVMPWNFPFWQVLRQAAPVLMAGNTVLLKHASNVPQCSLAIAELFAKTCPENVFQSLLIGSDQVEQIIEDFRVKGVSLTGSEYAGSQVAMQAGKNLKKTVLELGGNDPAIILADADLEQAAEIAGNSRLLNNGQNCIAAKRFIVVESVYEKFMQLLTKKFEAMKIGSPLDLETQLGPLADKRFLDQIIEQINKSVEAGAVIRYGGKKIEGKGYFIEPTILEDVKIDMPAYSEEIFGPVASVIKVSDTEEAIKIANDTKYGLGAAIWSEDIENAEVLASQLNAGAIFINGIVKSDPRLPFGGVNKGGYGRELSIYGLKEFTNIKTVWIR